MKAVILAGGLGSRLEPFSRVIPKPLLPIGESNVLELQILALKKHGFTDIIIATNYMANYVKTFLGNGKKYGVNIYFSKENKPLGTCGPIGLIKNRLSEPFLLMNGDILTTLNFKKLYQFALEKDADLTVVTKVLITPFDFGNVVSKRDYIIKVKEKPNISMEIVAGIYIIKPPIFELIPENTYYGMDSLIKDMLKKKMKIAKHLVNDYWLDIGRVDDYKFAQDAYKKHFRKLKNGH